MILNTITVQMSFLYETIVNNLTFRTLVNLKDSDYFCNKSWTISYNLNTKVGFLS
jgi:hypothetical protein